MYLFVVQNLVTRAQKPKPVFSLEAAAQYTLIQCSWKPFRTKPLQITTDSYMKY